jgi:hypothetical protein
VEGEGGGRVGGKGGGRGRGGEMNQALYAHMDNKIKKILKKEKNKRPTESSVKPGVVVCLCNPSLGNRGGGS